MSQLKITTDNFNLSSKWRCSTGSNGTRFIVEGPTTSTKTVAFAYSLPVGSIINSVKVYATLGSPLTGAAIKTANDVTLAGEALAECCAEQDLSSFDATASSYSVTFKFKAYGAVYEDSNYHEGALSFSDVYLLIDYTIPNSEWSMAASTVEAGNSVAITITPHDVTCSHALLVTFGELSETYEIAAGVSEYSLTVPLEWLEQIPTSTSGVATVKLKTLMNGVELGLSDATNLTIVCPESVVPIIGDLSIDIIDPVWGLCLQGYSKARLTATGCAGAYGSELQYGILECSPFIGGYWNAMGAGNVEFEFADKFTATGTITITASVVDSRERKASKTVTLEITPYSGPAISQTAQGRADSEGNANPQGTYVYAGAVYSYTAIGANSTTMQIYYREDGASDWVLGYEGKLASGDMVCFGGEFGTAIVYELKYVIADDLTTTSAIRTIGTAYAFMKWMPQSNAIGFGCIPRGVNMFEVGADWRVYAYGKDIEAYAPMRNYVDNGYFIHPVNQRAFDFQYEVMPASTIMYLDRWEVVGITEAWVNTTEGEGIHLVGVSADDYIEIRQRFEDYSTMAGKEYTVHCCIGGVEYCYAFTMGSCSAGQEIGGLTFYSTEDAHIAFRNSTATQITIQWVAVYEGALTEETLPKYVPKGHGVELAECSRYFMRVGWTSVDWVAQQTYVGCYLSENRAYFTIPGANQLRKKPEVLYGSWELEVELANALLVYNADGTQATITAVAFTNNQNGGVNAIVSIDETTAGAVHSMATLSVQTALHLSADL